VRTLQDKAEEVALAAPAALALRYALTVFLATLLVQRAVPFDIKQIAVLFQLTFSRSAENRRRLRP
jgi:hypothetical protein